MHFFFVVHASPLYDQPTSYVWLIMDRSCMTLKNCHVTSSGKQKRCKWVLCWNDIEINQKKYCFTWELRKCVVYKFLCTCFFIRQATFFFKLDDKCVNICVFPWWTSNSDPSFLAIITDLWHITYTLNNIYFYFNDKRC